MHETSTSFLPSVLLFLGAAVVAVPLFKRIGLGAMVGYLAAGVVIGPFGFRLFADTQTITHVAELGVVLLLFVIGLEMSRRGCGDAARHLRARRPAGGMLRAVLGGADLLRPSPRAAFIAGIGFALSSTAIALQILESAATRSRHGQRSFAVLLFQDLAIVPLLALVALLAATRRAGGIAGRHADRGRPRGARASAASWLGRYLLNPLFRMLAASGAREIMTAAALLVVLGAALLMQPVGLSMAMGAFLAGVMLAESNFRHQLEADIEPFRGLLLGLFFMGVGMSIDGRSRADWLLLVGATLGVIGVKAARDRRPVPDLRLALARGRALRRAARARGRIRLRAAAARRWRPGS